MFEFDDAMVTNLHDEFFLLSVSFYQTTSCLGLLPEIVKQVVDRNGIWATIHNIALNKQKVGKSLIGQKP